MPPFYEVIFSISESDENINKFGRNSQKIFLELKDVEKLLKLDPSNTELLAQKQRLLTDVIKETKEKLETLKTAG